MSKRNIPFSPPDITQEEIDEVVDTMKSGWITTGPKTKLLENKIAEFCHTPKAVCLNSATACLEMALRLLEIGPGDEVLVPAYTYTATASAVYHVGARPILIDLAENSYEMDYNKMTEAITAKTKAVIPVDLGGVLCNYPLIMKGIEKKRHLFQPAGKLQKQLNRVAVVADSAHAIGAVKDGRRSGQWADFTSFSFHAVKNLTTGEGGALVWNEETGFDHEELYQKLMLLSLHGQSKDALSKMQLGAWEYDVVDPYFKCNMTDIMASIGLVQLKRYSEILNKRRELITLYEELLKECSVKLLKHYGDGFSSSGHLLIMNVNNRDREYCNKIIIEMAEQGVATNVHYKPLPMLSAYKKLGWKTEDFPNAMKRFENEITLPLYSKMTPDDVSYVVQALKKTL